MRRSFPIGLSLFALALLVVGCDDGGRRRGNGGVTPMGDAGTSDGNLPEVDLGPLPDDGGPGPDGGVGGECGDGNVDEGEECDELGPSESCDSDCTLARCGDGTINSFREESCDDGNTASGDGCSAGCQTEIPASCGDRTVNAGEDCDAGPSGSSSCDSDCSFARCGDFTVNSFAGESCDAGAGSSSSCDSDCTLATCGDGTVNPFAGEACDDGDASGADGCSAACAVESGWTCTAGSPSSCARIGGGTIDRSASPFLSIPDSVPAGVTSNLSITGAAATACTIASVTVDINLTHTYIGDLEITLTSPGGAPLTLHTLTGGSADNLVGTYLTTLTPHESLFGFAGASVAGTWSMHVADLSATDTGVLNSWGLHITCL